MTFETHTAGRVGLSGFLQFRDKNGVVIKEVEINGSVPLPEGLTAEQAQELINSQEQSNGTDHRE